ncbi:MAG: hypothetical protein ABSF95_21585 [Verrucomicrobiota bacterium]|jgi:hypothetical protein
MNSQQKELFRLALLRVFGANKTRFGLGLEAVCHFVAIFGFASPDRDQAADAIDYLARKQLLEEVPNPVSPENRLWRITGPGIAFLDERG